MPPDLGQHAVREQRLAVVRAELEQRIERGEYSVCEDVLTRAVDLSADPDSVLELIYAEYAALDRLGKNPDPNDYYRRFPHLRERLSLVLKIHAAFKHELGEEEASLSRWPWIDEASTDDNPHHAAAGSPKRIGQYEVLEEVGRGGMGIVFKARQVDLNRIVALKIIRSPLATREELSRFRQEAVAAAQLEHPNIVTVHEISQHLGFPYLSFEFVSGGNLAERVAERPINANDAASFVQTLARAVAYAHGQGVVHRDLKPANILLTDDRQPKIADFGLAKLLTDLAEAEGGPSTLTQTGAVLGTPCYMSPEQVGGKPETVGPATDIYALGAILYEMLTGRPPFQGESTIETLEQIRHHEPTPPHRLRPRLRRDYDTICLKCLEKDPGRRYPSATALADDLARALAGRPIVARPVRFPERAAKWLYRQPAIAALIAGVIVVALAGATGVVLQWRRAEEGWRRAEIAHQSELALREQAQLGLYRHLIATAHRDLLNYRFRQSELVLDQCRSEFRHWEWYYLKRLCHPERMTLANHSQAVRRAQYLPDGRHLVTATGDWGTGHPGRLQLFDAETGHVIWGTDVDAGPIMDLAVSPDGSLMVTACANFGRAAEQAVTIWDAATGKSRRHLSAEIGNAFAVALSPDGEIVATGGSDGRVRLFRSASGDALRVLAGHTDNVHGVAFSPDGAIIASASRDGSARIWDAASGMQLQSLPCGADQRSVAFSPNGQLLATAGYGGVALLWDLAQTVPEPTPLPVDAGMVRGLSFAPDGELLAGIDAKGVIHLWRVPSGEMAETLYGHDAYGNQTAFSPDGSRLASASGDGTVKIWDVHAEHLSAARAKSRSVTEGGWVSALAYNCDGRLLAIASDRNPVNSGVVDFKLRLVDRQDPNQTQTLSGHSQGVTSMAFSPDGKQIATGSRDHTVRVWDVSTAESLWTGAGHTAAVNDVAFVRDTLYSAGEDGLLLAWEPASRTRPICVFECGVPITCLDVSPNSLLVLLDNTGEVRFWDASASRLLTASIRVAGPVGIMSMRPDGKQLAIATGSEVVVWDTSSLDEGRSGLISTLAGHTARVTALTYSSDGKRLVSVGQDKNVRLWDSETGTEMLTLQTPSEDTLAVAFDPQQQQLVVAYHGSLMVWDTVQSTTASASK